MPRNKNLTLPCKKNAKLNPIHFIVGGCPPYEKKNVVYPNEQIQYDQELINGRYPPGTKATFSCKSGYSAIFSKPARCNQEFWWDHPVERCRGI